MFVIYQLIISLLLIVSPIIIFYRISNNKEDPIRYKEKFSVPSKKRIKGKLIWFHGASVGEILSIIPIVKNYEKNKKILKNKDKKGSKLIKKIKSLFE